MSSAGHTHTIDAAVAPRAVPVCEGGVVWLTGLSGAGKSTLAQALGEALTSHGIRWTVLDGDVLRQGLNRDLGFSEADRRENIRRVGEVAALFAEAGVIAIVAVISPLAEMREQARAAAGERFCEVYVKASLATCEARDPKGLYKRARRGELLLFTGVSAPYEVPENPAVVADTEKHPVEQCVAELVAYVEQRFTTQRAAGMPVSGSAW
jgi:adenylyl-sulfate kinase